MYRIALLLLLLGAGVMITQASEPTAEQRVAADEAIHKYLSTEAKKLSGKFMDGAKTKSQWQEKRPELQRQFLDMLGLWPLPEKSDLKATVTGTLEKSGVIIEKLHYQSRPELYVTANLYRPKNAEGKKLPAILYVCGHSNRGRDGNKTAFQDHGLWFASNGYVCLVVDTLQLGEVEGKHHGTYNLGRFWWIDRGYTPAGVECWNGMRGIDYLCSRPEVDPGRIGVTGISGGGATTVWLAAADDRVKVAVPVSGMSDLESYVTNKVVNGHCDCMFMHNTYQWDWATILMLFAPKPVLFANSDKDPIFPMDGNRRIVARLRQGYALLGGKDHVDEHVSPGGHDYRPDLRKAVFQFFQKHLQNDSTAVSDAEFPKIEGMELRVFPLDSDLPRDSINHRIDEEFVPRAEVKLPDAKNYANWRADMIRQIRERSFRAFPEQLRGGEPQGPFVDGIMPWRTGGGPNIRVLELAEGTDLQDNLAVLNADEEPAKAGKFWSTQGGKSRRTMGIFPRGSGPDRWTRKNPPNTVERSLVLLGQTADAGRVRDVTSVLIGDPRSDPKYRLVGTGAAGVIAAYAALLAPGTVDEVVILDPPTSHRNGPHFLNIERVVDLPTALGLLAPQVKLTLVNARDKAFDRTEELYRLAGVPEQFRRE